LHDGAGRRVDIAARLKTSYDSMVENTLPRELQSLLERLDQQSPSSRN
jgi:hypothetical protein